MSAPGGDTPAPRAQQALLASVPGAAQPATPADVVAGMGLWDRSPEAAPPPRPRVLLNMISSADGRATLAGRSGGLSGAADRALFHALRAPVDAVLVGAGTVRAERYGRLIRDEHVRELRREHGLRAEPLACIVSASLALDPDIPLLADADAHAVMLTPSARRLAPARAEVSYVRCGIEGRLDLAAALTQLSERFGVRVLLCEGGPHLARDLLAAGLLDELFLSISPRLVGGASGAVRELRILAGPELDPPVALALQGALESESHLFLHYCVVAPERVSRDTIDSSSLAR